MKVVSVESKAVLQSSKRLEQTRVMFVNRGQATKSAW